MTIERLYDADHPRHRVWALSTEFTETDDGYVMTDKTVSAKLGFGSEIYLIDKPSVVLFWDSTHQLAYLWTTDCEGGGSAKLQELMVTENGSYMPDEGYDGFSSVDVTVPPPVLFSLSATANDQYDPFDYNADGFDSVTVNVQPTLVSLTATQAGDYNPQDYNAEGFSAVHVVATDLNEAVTVNTTLEDLVTDICTELSKTMFEVASLIANRDINIIVSVAANATLGTPAFKLYNAEDLGTGEIFFGTVGGADSTAATWQSGEAWYKTSDGTLLCLYMLAGGTVTDLAQYAPMFSCTATVLLHPMPVSS